MQTGSPFTIDADLEDWKDFPEIPVELTPDGQVLGGSPDLTVAARFSFDAGYFYAADFIVGPAKSLEFQSLMNGNHFTSGDEPKVNLAILSPEAQQDWRIRMIATTGVGNFSSENSLAFESGLSTLSFPVEMGKVTTGVVDLSLGVLDNQGRLRYTDDQRFFLFDRDQFDGYEAKLAALREGEKARDDTVFRESLLTLEIRLEWIRDFMEKPQPFADLEAVQEWNMEIKDLFRKVDDGEPALFLTARIARLGYRTEGDGSLRSYWVFIPDWYKEETPLPLLVTLAGGRANPRGAVFALTSGYFGPRAKKRAGDFFILAPEVDNRFPQRSISAGRCFLRRRGGFAAGGGFYRRDMDRHPRHDDK